MICWRNQSTSACLSRASLPSCTVLVATGSAVVTFCSSYLVNLFCCVAVDLSLAWRSGTRSYPGGEQVSVLRLSLGPHVHSLCPIPTLSRLRAASPSSHVINSGRTRGGFPSNAGARHSAPYQTQHGTRVEKKCQLGECFGSGCALNIQQGLLSLCPYVDDDLFDSQFNVLEMGTS